MARHRYEYESPIDAITVSTWDHRKATTFKFRPLQNSSQLTLVARIFHLHCFIKEELSWFHLLLPITRKLLRVTYTMPTPLDRALNQRVRLGISKCLAISILTREESHNWFCWFGYGSSGMDNLGIWQHISSGPRSQRWSRNLDSWRASEMAQQCEPHIITPRSSGVDSVHRNALTGSNFGNRRDELDEVDRSSFNNLSI